MPNTTSKIVSRKTVRMAVSSVIMLCVAAVCSRAQQAVISTTDGLWRTRMVVEDTVPLPEDWHSAGFDAGQWPHYNLALPVEVNAWGFGGGRNIHQLAVRGYFSIENPAQAGALTLTLAYRGGVVVYLNGTEIARQHLAEGDDVLNMAAEVYGKEAWFVEGDDDKPVTNRNTDQYADWLREHRLRHVRNLTLPAELLQAGKNVLAILVNSAPDPMDHTGRFRDRNWPRLRDGRFLGVGLVEAELLAAGSGVTSARKAHPEGIRIWAASPYSDITPDSYPHPEDEEAVLRLIGPRGGQASAPIVTSSSQPFPAPKITMAGLDGDSLQLLYASRVHRDAVGADDGYEYETYSVLGTNPGPDALHHPVWVLVDIPENARPGVYRGQAQVTAGEVAENIAVELTVGAYQLPDRRQYVSLVGMMHQAENTAYRYDVPLWSDEHMPYLAQSLELLGGIGNNILWLPMAMPSVLGTSQTIVYWEERDGRLQPDLTNLERYLRLYNDIVGPPRLLGLHLWEGEGRGIAEEGMQITRRNADGSTETVNAPWYSAEGGVEFWKPVVDATRAIVRDIGWPEYVVMLSAALDGKPSPPTIEAFNKIAPGLKWNVFSHARGYSAPWDTTEWNHNGLNVGFHEEPWSPRRRSVNAKGVIGGWNHVFPQASAARFHFSTLGDDNFRHAIGYRNLVTGNVAGGRGTGLGNRTFWGVSRFWFDYWPVRRPGSERYGRTRGMRAYGNLIRNRETIIAPGIDGPERTVQYQQIREGLQETEARLIIEIALDNDDLRSRLGDELVARCMAVMRENVRMYDAAAAIWGAGGALPWHNHARELFDTAGAVQQTLNVLSLHDRAPMHQAH